MPKDHKIPTKDPQQFFNHYGLRFTLQYFDVPEASYESGNISFYETAIICLICKNLKPKRVLEFGTFNGRTTTNISANISNDANIITVDLPRPQIKETKFALEGMNKSDEHDETGYVGRLTKLFSKYPQHDQKIMQMWMDTANFPVKEYNRKFDLIFVDASHTYENTLNDSKNVIECIADNGIILWHDYNGWPGVTQALDEFYSDYINDNFNMFHIKGTSMVAYYARSN